MVIRYPALGEEYGQIQTDYFLELLNLALSRSGKVYRLEPVIMSEFRESRSVMSVAKGMYDVHWMNTNERRESVLRPIRIPLYKGLIGWRLLMIRDGDQARFATLDGLEPLKSLKTVQGHDWPDTNVLLHNGFNVVRSASWEGMFKMLYAGRVDYFPRSALEVWDEVEAFSELDFSVDQSLALVYPSAYYFFVNRANREVAEAIERGLDRAIEDGSFDELFLSYHGESIRRAKLDQRKILRIDNPMMTPQTPLDREELWYQP
ncbi:transporter substrate-binding domain-containing protein [Marinimicrobium sp. C2-29]|uniref:transporter substrate-binding domain-containing protein n=1 Tax=Marinimicrobium sp. C2-29 TaxID=3139825 RepID=UPI003138BAFD